MTDEERIFSCQQEIRRRRGVVREYEEKRRVFLEWKDMMQGKKLLKK